MSIVPQHEETSPAALALFDFDCTLTTCDTIRPFVMFLLNNHNYPQMTRLATRLLVSMLEMRLIPNHVFKVFLVWLLLRGQAEAEISQIARDFHEEVLNAILNRDVFACLDRYIAEGKDVYLVSSNFDFVLEPLQELWNLKGILATNTEKLNGTYTGRIVGRTCHGREKVARVITEFGQDRVRQAIAYGDSPSDKFLLDIVNSGYWIRPELSPHSSPAN